MAARKLVLVALTVLAALLLAPTAQAKAKPNPIVGFWSRTRPAFTYLLPGWPAYMLNETVNFVTVSPTSDPTVFSAIWSGFVPTYNITDEMRHNGPTLFSPRGDAQLLWQAAIYEIAPLTYTFLSPVPWFSATGTIETDVNGTGLLLYAVGELPPRSPKAIRSLIKQNKIIYPPLD